MKLSKKKVKENELIAKRISNAALITFFIFYIMVPLTIFDPEQSVITTIEVLVVIFNALAINRYIGLGLSIFSYMKYKSNYSKKVMILCIILQTISLIAFIYWSSTVDFSIDG